MDICRWKCIPAYPRFFVGPLQKATVGAVINVCLVVEISIVDKKWPSSTVMLPRVALLIIRPVYEFILLEAVIRNPWKSPEESFWSNSIILSSTLRPEDAMGDFGTNSTFGITKLPMAVSTESWILISTIVITLFSSLCTLLTMVFSNVCIPSAYHQTFWTHMRLLCKSLLLRCTFGCNHHQLGLRIQLFGNWRESSRLAVCFGVAAEGKVGNMCPMYCSGFGIRSCVMERCKFCLGHQSFLIFGRTGKVFLLVWLGSLCNCLENLCIVLKLFWIVRTWIFREIL